MVDITSGGFRPYEVGYHPANAAWLAYFASLAYTKMPDGRPDGSRIMSMLQHTGRAFRAVRAFNHKSSQGILIQHEDYVVAAFRGTDEPADWLDNLRLMRARIPMGCSVHSGFQAALEDIWHDMYADLDHFRRQDDGTDRPLWITGHSLGGALATLAAADLVDRDDTWYGCYTFGSPRVGDRDFARIMNAECGGRLVRFQNNADIVTRVPTRLSGYSHCGRFCYISEDGDLSWNVSWWYRFMDTVKGIAGDIGKAGLEGIKDHDLNEYFQALVKYADYPSDE